MADSDKMTFVCEDDVLEKVGIIMRQTDYTQEIAREKLLSVNMDHMRVIKEFYGIVEKKPTQVKSLQQQIYKEIRHKLDDSIRDFNIKQEKKLELEIEKNKQ
jgi:hypothetical protein